MRFFGSIYRGLLLSFIFGSFASCGPSPQAGGGIGGTGNTASVTTVAAGPVTGFGSVFVSGNEFGTNGAVITVDGQANAGEGHLKKGMVVLVNGTISKDYGTGQTVQWTAKMILHEDTIKGPDRSSLWLKTGSAWSCWGKPCSSTNRPSSTSACRPSVI